METKSTDWNLVFCETDNFNLSKTGKRKIY